MTPERQRHVLIALLVVLAVLIGWRRLGLSAGSDEATPVDRVGPATDGESVTLAVEELRLSDLDLEPAEFRLGRDPFRFAVAPPPPREPLPQEPKPPRPEPLQAAPAGSALPATPQPPPVDVVYLGRFGPSARPIAVFTDGTEIYNVIEGEVIKGQFLVDNIGYESADLKFVGFPDAPTERLAVGG